MVFSFIFSIIYFALIFNLFERPVAKTLNTAFNSYKNSLWYSIVTMTTIGYGDIVCKTLMARVFVMFLVIWGNFWNSIFLSSIYPYIN